MTTAMIGIGVEALLTRLPGPRIEELEWDTDALLFRGPKTLRLAWDTRDYRRTAARGRGNEHS